MSGVLVLGVNEQQQIDALVRKARANVVSWEVLSKAIVDDREKPKATLMLDERPPGFERPPSDHIMLGTYRAAFSFEEQPAGIIRHLSVSAANPTNLPGQAVMEMICRAFGFSDPTCRLIGGEENVELSHPGRVWVEEFDPGHMAVNVIEVEA